MEDRCSKVCVAWLIALFSVCTPFQVWALEMQVGVVDSGPGRKGVSVGLATQGADLLAGLEGSWTIHYTEKSADISSSWITGAFFDAGAIEVLGCVSKTLQFGMVAIEPQLLFGPEFIVNESYRPPGGSGVSSNYNLPPVNSIGLVAGLGVKGSVRSIGGYIRWCSSLFSVFDEGRELATGESVLLVGNSKIDYIQIGATLVF